MRPQHDQNRPRLSGAVKTLTFGAQVGLRKGLCHPVTSDPKYEKLIQLVCSHTLNFGTFIGNFEMLRERAWTAHGKTTVWLSLGALQVVHSCHLGNSILHHSVHPSSTTWSWRSMWSVGKTVVPQPTLEAIFEYTGHLIVPTPESMPNQDATIYESTVEGSKQIVKHAGSDAVSRSSFEQLQTGFERPMRSKGMYTVSTSPWSSTMNNPGHYDALTIQKLERPFGSQGDVWDCCGDLKNNTGLHYMSATHS